MLDFDQYYMLERTAIFAVCLAGSAWMRRAGLAVAISTTIGLVSFWLVWSLFHFYHRPDPRETLLLGAVGLQSGFLILRRPEGLLGQKHKVFWRWSPEERSQLQWRLPLFLLGVIGWVCLAFLL